TLVGRRLNLLDPQDNVTAGVAILRQLVRTAPDLDTAIAGYYQGLAGVLRNGMYSDTRNYVAGIKSLMRQFCPARDTTPAPPHSATSHTEGRPHPSLGAEWRTVRV